MRIPVRCLLAFVLLFLPFTTSCRPADRTQSSAPWTTHTDPSGYSVSTPAGWSVARDARQGRIALRGAHGEQIVVWPIFIEKKQLDAPGANRLVMQLARELDGQLPWEPANGGANAVRVVARGAQRSGATLMVWSNTQAGAAVFVYAIEAAPDVYRSSADTFARILKSFHGVQDVQSKTTASPAGSGPLTYVNWNDPREGAFALEAPKGWQVVGGSYRLTATDIREGVTMISPDAQIRVFIGDTGIGAFTEPTRMLAYGGLREGSVETLGDGSKLEIRSYMPGQQFTQAYVQSRLAPHCSGLQMESNGDREDLAGAFLQSARNEGMPSARLTAGDVAFNCNDAHGPVHGHIFAATIYPMPGRATIWYVYRLYGYFASPQNAQAAEAIAQQVMQSWRVNPQWEAREKEIANEAVQQDNARSQQIRAQAMQAIQEDQRETSDMIVSGYEQRSQVYDEVSRRRENAILGTSDVIDPATGTQYKVDSLSDYHWMSDTGVIAGTETETNPGYGWNEMVTLP